MIKKSFDIASDNGIDDLKQELESIQEKLKSASESIPFRLKDEFLTNVDEQGRIINVMQMRMAVMYGHTIHVEGNNMIKISNNTQHATYAEFGTGTVGESSTKHPLPELEWEHNVANREPDQGWNYFHNGRFWHTKGVMANPTYYTSLQLTIDKLPEIGKKEIEKVLK